MYRILKVSGIATGIRLYRGIIEVMVDSAALYSAMIVVLTVLLVLEVHNENVGNYLTSIAVEMRVIVLFFDVNLTQMPLFRELYLQFWSAVLLQGIHAQTMAGVIREAQCHRLSSEIIQSAKTVALEQMLRTICPCVQRHRTWRKA